MNRKSTTKGLIVENDRYKSLLKQAIWVVQKHEKSFTFSIVAIIVIVGLVYSVVLGDILRYPDEREYVSIANSIVTDGVYALGDASPTALRPPGYPWLLSVFLYFGANVAMVRFVNFVLLAAIAYLLNKTLQSLSPIAGPIALLLVPLYPVVFYTAGTLYPQIFGSFSFLLFIYLVFGRNNKSISDMILPGATMGILILSIPTFLAVLAATIPFGIRHGLGYRKLTILVLSSTLLVGLWTARNYMQFKAFIPISTNSGLNLLLGNSANTTPNSGVNVDLSRYTPPSELNEYESDQYYRSQAIKFIIENKGRALLLYCSKFLNHFNYRNELATETESSAPRGWLMFLTYYPLLVLAILRLSLFKTYPLSMLELYFITMYLVGGLVQAVFFTRIRFRIPFDFLLIGLVASYLSNVFRSFVGTAAKSDLFRLGRAN